MQPAADQPDDDPAEMPDDELGDPLAGFPALWHAVFARDLPLARQLLAAGHPIDGIAAIGGTLLHDAARNGDAEVVRLLLAHGAARFLDTFDECAVTPLACAAERGHDEIVALLLEAGSDPDAHDEARIGDTALRDAVRGGHVAVVERLLAAGADPTIEGWMGISAVDQAWYQVDGGLDGERAARLQQLLRRWPSALRDARERDAGPR
jgi:ankyrin repeat protein